MSRPLDNSGWKTIDGIDGTIHVMPIDDVFSHIEHRECLCHPKLDLAGTRAVVIHNSRDGREVYERAVAGVLGRCN